MAHEGSNDIISVVAITDQILATEQHLERGVRHQFLESAHSFPRVFVKKTGSDIKSSATPDFYGIKSSFVHFRGNGDHILRTHTCCKQRLVSITKGQIGNLEWICHLSPHLQFVFRDSVVYLYSGIL